MAKKKGMLGKLIALTTTAAAIGGVCYVFRDKIKESQAFKTASKKANDLYGTVKSKIGSDDDDFFFDDDWDESDDDIFNTDENTNREYTSLTPSKDADNTDDVNDNDTESETDSTPDSIPTIDLNKDSVSEYENEGLSDTSEDPDVLEDQDKLDF